MNNDNAPEAIMRDAAGVGVLQGLGNGAVETERHTPLPDDGASSFPPFPRAVVALDLQGDGVLDFAVIRTQADQNNLLILRGNSTGAFQVPVRLNLVGSPEGITAADVDTDGLPDLVITNPSTGELLILFSAPDGSLPQERRIPVGNIPSSSVLSPPAAADVNSDGLLDLVLVAINDARREHIVTVLLRIGGGDFQAPRSFMAPFGAALLGVVDMDGDSLADVVLSVGTRVLVHLNNGDGTFQDELSTDAERNIGAGTVADVNTDGLPDITTVGGTSSSDITFLAGSAMVRLPRRSTYRQALAKSR